MSDFSKFQKCSNQNSQKLALQHEDKINRLLLQKIKMTEYYISQHLYFIIYFLFWVKDPLRTVQNLQNWHFSQADSRRS